MCPDAKDPQKEKLDGVRYAEIKDCDFMGSERMEFLLQALHHEQDAGRTFRKFIEKSENTVRPQLFRVILRLVGCLV